MTCQMRPFGRRAWKISVIIAFIASIALGNVPDLAAQRPESTEALELGVSGDIPDLIGSWRARRLGLTKQTPAVKS